MFHFQHQQQVAMAVDRAKQINMAELNAIMQVSGNPVVGSNLLEYLMLNYKNVESNACNKSIFLTAFDSCEVYFALPLDSMLL